MARPATYRERQTLMDAERVARTLRRMALEIAEHQRDLTRTVIVGVRTRGVPLARRLSRLLKEASGVEPPVGALDITLYRDDLTTIAAQPIMKGTEIPFSIDGRTVVLADDVLYTGRTVRAALDELIDFGRPARIQLAVLVDRGHRELPIRADYVGKTLTTARQEIVQVLLTEEDGEDRVALLEPVEAAREPAPLAEGGKRASPRPTKTARRPAAPRSRAGRRDRRR